MSRPTKRREVARPAQWIGALGCHRLDRVVPFLSPGGRLASVTVDCPCGESHIVREPLWRPRFVDEPAPELVANARQECGRPSSPSIRGTRSCQG